MLTVAMVAGALGGAALVVWYYRRRRRMVSGEGRHGVDTPGARLDRIRRAGL